MGTQAFAFFGKISSLSQSCTCTVSMVSTDITEGFPEQNSHITGRDADMPGQPSCVSFFFPAHFQRGENERNHASYQNNGKTCYAENQIPDIKTLSVTIHGINIIHSLKNSGDNLRLACPSCISDWSEVCAGGEGKESRYKNGPICHSCGEAASPCPQHLPFGKETVLRPSWSCSVWCACDLLKKMFTNIYIFICICIS